MLKHKRTTKEIMNGFDQKTLHLNSCWIFYLLMAVNTEKKDECFPVMLDVFPKYNITSFKLLNLPKKRSQTAENDKFEIFKE